MHSKKHAVFSAVIGILFAVRYRRPVLFVIAVAAGVGIDFDHFLLAWYDHNDLRGARRAIENPNYVFKDQGKLFAEEASFSVRGGRLTTLCAHTTEAFGAALVADIVCDEEVACTVFASMAFHVACDSHGYVKGNR